MLPVAGELQESNVSPEPEPDKVQVIIEEVKFPRKVKVFVTPTPGEALARTLKFCAVQATDGDSMALFGSLDALTELLDQPRGI